MVSKQARTQPNFWRVAIFKFVLLFLDFRYKLRFKEKCTNLLNTLDQIKGILTVLAGKPNN